MILIVAKSTFHFPCWFTQQLDDIFTLEDKIVFMLKFPILTKKMAF